MIDSQGLLTFTDALGPHFGAEMHCRIRLASSQTRGYAGRQALAISACTTPAPSSVDHSAGGAPTGANPSPPPIAQTPADPPCNLTHRDLADAASKAPGLRSLTGTSGLT